MDEHGIDEHGMDETGEFSFVQFLSSRDEQEHASPSFGSNDGLGLDLSEPLERELEVEPSESLVSDSVIARELAILESQRETDLVRTVDFSRAVQVASQSLSVSSTKPIWETGVWSQIFGDSSMPHGEVFEQNFRRPFLNVSAGQIDGETALAKPAKAARTSEDYHDVVKMKHAGTWQEQVESGLQQALKLWYTVISRWDARNKLHRDIMDCGTDIDAIEMLGDIFRGRSHVTLKKRAFAINRICDFLYRNFKPMFPCCESDLYEFYRHERMHAAPTSRIRGYNQAINFCLHVLGADELEPCAKSRRCLGAGKSDDPKDRVQASPLKVVELQKIHDMLQNSDSIWTSYFCGCVLLCTYARARWGDLMRSEKLIIDEDDHGQVRYVEVHVGRHKTMHSQQHRHAFLPMVAPSFGIDPKPWSERWLQLRKELKIKSPPNHAIMPAPDQWGDVTDRPLETAEAGAWLRKILFGSKQHLDDRRISTHSLKTTFLSYAAKRGLSVPERLQMGYHTSQFQMAMVYSRDGASAVLMTLEKLINEIKSGIFLPDVTRSGRIVSQDEAESSRLVEVKAEQVHDVVVIEDSETDAETSDSSSDSSCSSAGEDTRVLNRMFKPPVAPEGYVMWQHAKLKTLHLMDEGNSRVFECGRTVGSFHSKEGIAPRYDTPIRHRCFKLVSRP